MLLRFSLVVFVFAVSFPLAFFLDYPKWLRIPGALVALAGPIYFSLGIWELFRYQRGWRVVTAIVVSAVATAIVWGTAILRL
jgi:hypothetical protein